MQMGSWLKNSRKRGMDENMKIAIIGSGSWGTAVAALLSDKGYDIWLWSWLKEESERLSIDRENKEFLPNVMLPGNITCTHDMGSCVEGADLVITAAPSHAMRNVAKMLSGFVSEGQRILNISKGLEEDTLLRLSQVIGSQIPQARVSVMSGPSHAEEVGRRIATANVVASEHIEDAEWIQDVFMHSWFRVYTSQDMAGVEYGGAVKNVVALAAGIAVGLGCGDNTSAALMTRGIAEISRLGAALGAKAETFGGLTGIGDLMVTCMSVHSRNRRAGVLMGKGYTLEEALNEVHMVVEGVRTCAAAYKLSQMHGVSMPITECTYRILYENLSAKDALAELMGREKRHETERDILQG